MVFQKRVVDEVSGWLRVFSDGTVDRSWTGPPHVKFMVEPVPPHEEFVDGVATRDVVVDDKSGLTVRVYLPDLPEKYSDKLPIILHFHGGGFCISQADWFMYYNIYTKLARQARAICVSVYLRLAPENRLPAAIDDGFSALKWLGRVAQGESTEPWLASHGDFGRVFLIGDSSGGNLVHEVAARAGNNQPELGPVCLTGAIPIHPGFVRSARSRSEMEQPQSPFLTLDMLDKFLNLGLPEGSNKDHPITCPMGESAPPLSGLTLPPFLLCLAEKDLVWDTEMEYYECMKNAGKDVELFVSHGMMHSFYLNKLAIDFDPETSAETDRLFSRISDFIHEH